MNCRLDNFDLNKTWIILTAGKKNTLKEDLYLERRILNSLSDYVSKEEPRLKGNIYGHVATVLLFEDDLKLLDIPGIGFASRARIMEIRDYLNGKDIYRWIFDKSNIIKGKRKEVIETALFGDVVEDKNNNLRLDKEYEVSLNGYIVSDDEFKAGYKKLKFHINLTNEERSGIEKLVKVLDKSQLTYVTGLGVSHKGEF